MSLIFDTSSVSTLHTKKKKTQTNKNHIKDVTHSKPLYAIPSWFCLISDNVKITANHLGLVGPFDTASFV